MSDKLSDCKAAIEILRAQQQHIAADRSMCDPECELPQWDALQRVIDMLGALAAPPAPAIPAVDREAIIEQCAVRAATHSQYPVETDFDRGYEKARLDAARSIRTLKAVLPISESEDAVAWQVRRADGRIDGVPIQWEHCTKELYDATLATGRYAGYENGPRCEVRELFAARDGGGS